MADAPPEKKVEEGAPDWVVTFGDLMSLLLCFFVLLLSFSEMDRQKFKQVAGSMAEAFGIQRKDRFTDSPMGVKMIAQDFEQDLTPQHDKEEYVATQMNESVGNEIKEEVKTRFQELQERVSIEAGDKKLTIRLMGESAFDVGRAEVRAQAVPLIIKIGESLKTTGGDIVIAGHTDNVPVRGGPYGSNLQLSIQRAANVAQILLDKVGIEPRRVSTMGFGQYRPIADNDTPEGREKNRRVEIILTQLPPAQ